MVHVFGKVIEDETRKEGVNPDLIKAIMFVESARFDKNGFNRLAELLGRIAEPLGIGRLLESLGRDPRIEDTRFR